MHLWRKINISAFIIRWMPESARWLIANGKVEQAQIYLKKCAKMIQKEDMVHTLDKEVGMVLMFKSAEQSIYSRYVLISSTFFKIMVLRCFGFFQTLSAIVVTDKKNRTYSYLDLIRTPKMRKLALSTGILWSVVQKPHFSMSIFRKLPYVLPLTFELISIIK